jgi:Flp pilus assembly protein TadG
VLARGRTPQRGVSTVEFHIVALFALLPLCFGILQVAVLLVDNHHIDYAAYMAARRGATAQGDMGAMRNRFARALTALDIDAATPLDRGNVPTRVAATYARVIQDVTLHARFRLLAPSPTAQADFAVNREGVRVIPNDALALRPAAAGARSGLSLQEANVLRLEINYCRPLIVPLVRELLLLTLRTIDADPWHQRCYAAGRVPIRSEGIAAMQSDFRVTS